MNERFPDILIQVLRLFVAVRIC